MPREGLGGSQRKENDVEKRRKHRGQVGGGRREEGIVSCRVCPVPQRCMWVQRQSCHSKTTPLRSLPPKHPSGRNNSIKRSSTHHRSAGNCAPSLTSWIMRGFEPDQVLCAAARTSWDSTCRPCTAEIRAAMEHSCVSAINHTPVWSVRQSSGQRHLLHQPKKSNINPSTSAASPPALTPSFPRDTFPRASALSQPLSVDSVRLAPCSLFSLCVCMAPGHPAYPITSSPMLQPQHTMFRTLT